MKITTKSGSVYIVENGFWSRNGGSKNKIWRFFSVPKDAEMVEDIVEAGLPAPQMGYAMYFDNLDMWQVTTEIVKIEDV